VFSSRRGEAMRSYVINKLLCLQYRLRRIVGKKAARKICIILESAFVTLLGREVYHGRK
jgi:hypothetical protein